MVLKNFDTYCAEREFTSHLVFEYGEKKILNNVNYNFELGKIYGLKGESGSGKTTLIDLILGLLKPSSGQIYINDVDILKNNVTGLLAKPFSIIEFSNLMKLCSKDTEIIDKLSQKAYSHSRQFSHKKRTKVFINTILKNISSITF